MNKTPDANANSSLDTAEAEWRAEAVSSLRVPVPPSRRALAATLRTDVPLPRGSNVRELIEKSAAGEPNEDVDPLVISLGVALIYYSNWLAEERWLGRMDGEALDRAEARIEDLEARLDAVRKATWGR